MNARYLLWPLVALTSTLCACAGAHDEPLMNVRSPDTLLTAYLVATGMAEHRLIDRVSRHQATRRDIAVLIAIDHNAWDAVRRAILKPGDGTIAQADASLMVLLDQAPPPAVPSPASTPAP